MGSTSFRKNSGDSPVMIKSSAYRTKFILLKWVSPFIFLRVGSFAFRNFSRPSNVMFIRVGEIVPPWGVPSSVGNKLRVSMNPHFSHFIRICVSIGIFSTSHWWLIWSKHPFMSPSRIHWGDFALFRSVKHCSMASCVLLPMRNP